MKEENANDRSDRIRLLMQAAIDGELDAVNMLEFEKERALDREIDAEYQRHVALRAVLRDILPKERAPDALRARLVALADSEINGAKLDDTVVSLRKPGRPVAALLRSRPWLAHAATAVLAAGLGASLSWGVLSPETDMTTSGVVSAHMRSLIATTPVDVTSSSNHTVKPWFDTHLALSPAVVDLSQAGYELVGGRADVISNAAAPTLVYRFREHLISVTALPARISVPEPSGLVGGYRLIAWRGEGFTYCATSDLPATELAAFVAAFREASSKEAKHPL